MGANPRMGSIEWAAAKAVEACRRGISETRRDCHAKAGDWIRRNQDAAMGDGCSLVLFALPSGFVAHSGIALGGRIYHDPRDVSRRDLAEYRIAARIPAAAILAAVEVAAAPRPAYG